MAVNGESHPLCDQVCDITGGRLCWVHNVLVAHNMTQQCLLGTDLHEQFSCVLNMDHKTLNNGGSQVNVVHVTVQETIVNPAFSFLFT